MRIVLIVRDTCRLRPGVAGSSEHVRVISIVGRFLEHARVFYFRNGGEEELFIGSADLMTRNLDRRVEVLVPIEPPELREELKRSLEVQLRDRRAGWEMCPDGSYVQRTPNARASRKSSQEEPIALTQQRHERALALKQGNKRRVRPRPQKRIGRPLPQSSQPSPAGSAWQLGRHTPTR